MRQPIAFLQKQTGVATLTIGLILLVVMSLMTIYLTKSGIVDIRTSADKVRHAEALNQAEMNLDMGLAWLSLDANRGTMTPSSWAMCNNATINSNLPAATTTAAWNSALGANWQCECRTAAGATAACSQSTLYIATPASNPGSVLYVIAGGQSADATANVIVKQGLYFSDGLFPGNPYGPPPLLGAGNIPLNGTFNVVANPNGGGQGVPVSIWSEDNITPPQGSAKTCHAGDYTTTCNNPMSLKDVKGVDIVDPSKSPSTVFPPDMFEYVFGVPTSNFTTVKDQATVVPNCSGLSAASSGFYWVTGDCDVPASTTLGGNSTTGGKPLILVVESADFKMNANSTFYGLIFAFDKNGNAGTMTMNGGATVYGSILSNDTVEMGININGTFNMIYDLPTMNAVINPPGLSGKLMSKMPGSWVDYL